MAYQQLCATDGAGVDAKSIPQAHAIFSTPVFGWNVITLSEMGGKLAKCLAPRYWLKLQDFVLYLLLMIYIVFIFLFFNFS